MTVYERNDRLGGLLRYGIPTMKLGKDVSSLQKLTNFLLVGCFEKIQRILKPNID